MLYLKLYLQCLMRGRDLVGVEKILQQGKEFSDRGMRFGPMDKGVVGAEPEEWLRWSRESEGV